MTPAERFLHDLLDERMTETCTIAALNGKCPNHPEFPRGAELRDRALAQSKQGRETRIQQVREWLRQARWFDGAFPENQLTADDVHDAADALGLGEGDTRWTGNVLKGWNAVVPTNQFVPSRRKERHCAPVRVWRWV